jgi:hypothetical protein
LSRHNYNARVFVSLALLAVLALALPAWAQLEIGSNTSVSLSGNIGVGYNGDYGNAVASDHSSTVDGDATLTGYYYSPKFVNFFASPMYNRSQANSGDGSITNASGINTGANLFGGSHFPGSLSFSETLDGSGIYGFPGVPGFTTHGNSRGFGASWGEYVPGLPPVTLSYSQSSSTSSFFGSDGDEVTGARNFGINSNYKIHGWFMNARFNDIATHTELPSFLTAGETIDGDSHSKAFNFNTNHKLPMQGGVSFGYAWSDFSGGSNGVTTTGSDQNLSASASFIPTKRLSTSFIATYDTSLSGQIEQQLVAAGSVAPAVNLGGGNYSASFGNFDNFLITKHLSASFSFTRLQQEVYGESIGVNNWNAILNYRFVKPLWGTFVVYFGANGDTSDGSQPGTGLVGGINFNRQIEGFEVSGSFGYAQNEQTVLAAEVTSNYSYMANARRHLSRRMQWTANFNGFHTGLGELPGYSSHSEGYGTNLVYKNYNFGAVYNKVSGTALLTASGLVTAPGALAPVLTGNQYLLNTGSSYSFTGTANPVQHLVVSGAYTKTSSDETGTSLNTASNSRVITAFMQYQFRKMSIGGGYTNLIQEIEATGLPPTNYSSFYVGIQRWFRGF